MSNPLAMFRKHQKILLAVFGVLLMIVFTVGSLVTQWVGQGNTANSGNTPVVIWRNGQINESDLSSLRFSRNQIRRFLELVRIRTQERGGQQQVYGVPPTDAEDSLMRTLVMATRAAEMGIDVSDDAILEYLDQYAGETVPRSEFGQLLRQATGGMMTEDQLFAGLRRELLAQRLETMARSGSFSITPAAAWEYFNRLNRQMSTELVAFPIDQYKSQVPEPAVDQVAGFYEENKDEFSNPFTGKSGLKQRRKVALSYVRADFKTYFDDELAKVTDDEVRAYYEENINDFEVTELPESTSFDALSPPVDPAADSGLSADALTDELDPEDSSLADEVLTDEPDDVLDLTPADFDLPAPEDSIEADVAPEEAQPEEAQPEEAQPEEAQPEEAQPEEVQPEVDEGAAFDGSLFKGIDTVQIELPDNVVAADSDSQPETSSDAPGRPSESSGNDGEASLPDGQSSGDEGADHQDPLDSTDEASLDTPAATDEQPSADEPASEVESEPEVSAVPKYRPLEEVAEEIKSSLARPRAQERMDAGLNASKAVMDKYFREYIKWDVMKADNPDVQKPVPPDLRQLVSQHQLITGEVPLSDGYELREYEIGQTYDINMTGGGSRIMFQQVAFDESLKFYRPIKFPELAFDVQYLFWKTGEQDESVLTPEEARPAVVEALKSIEALRIAKETAEDLAQRIQASGKTLREEFTNIPGNEPFEPPPFTWMSQSTVPMNSGGRPFISQVQQVQGAGQEFMSDVFQLEAGQVGVAVNDPKTVVYVVRIKGDVPTVDQRRDEFLGLGLSAPVYQLSIGENQQFMFDWVEQLEADFGVEWKRTPHPGSNAQ